MKYFKFSAIINIGKLLKLAYKKKINWRLTRSTKFRIRSVTHHSKNYLQSNLNRTTHLKPLTLFESS